MRGGGGALAAVVIGLLTLVLLCSTSAREEGEEGTHILLPTQGEEGDEEKGKKPWECCDLCVCTRSIPPWCQCRDQRVGGCHPGCKRCACTRSEPPQCRCDDIIQEYCGDPCAATVGLDKTTK